MNLQNKGLKKRKFKKFLWLSHVLSHCTYLMHNVPKKLPYKDEHSSKTKFGLLSTFHLTYSKCIVWRETIYVQIRDMILSMICKIVFKNLCVRIWKVSKSETLIHDVLSPGKILLPMPILYCTSESHYHISLFF